jgi:hypothetical protein
VTAAFIVLALSKCFAHPLDDLTVQPKLSPQIQEKFFDYLLKRVRFRKDNPGSIQVRLGERANAGVFPFLQVSNALGSILAISGSAKARTSPVSKTAVCAQSFWAKVPNENLPLNLIARSRPGTKCSGVVSIKQTWDPRSVESNRARTTHASVLNGSDRTQRR